MKIVMQQPARLIKYGLYWVILVTVDRSINRKMLNKR